MQEENLVLRDNGKRGSRSGKRSLWLYMTGGLAVRWTAVLVQAYWGVAAPCCKRQWVSTSSNVLINRSLLEPAVQLCKIPTCPQELPKGWLHGVGQRHLSSVSAALCSAQGQEDCLPLASGNSGNERADVWEWGPTSLKCVHVSGTQSPVNVTAFLKRFLNAAAPGRSWWCWKPSWSIAHTSPSFSLTASKVRLLFQLKLDIITCGSTGFY